MVGKGENPNDKNRLQTKPHKALYSKTEHLTSIPKPHSNVNPQFQRSPKKQPTPKDNNKQIANKPKTISKATEAQIKATNDLHKQEKKKKKDLIHAPPFHQQNNTSLANKSKVLMEGYSTEKKKIRTTVMGVKISSSNSTS